ncbi:MAG: class I SAM-dependent RNA methyltransferase, partial [Tomitella sp.]|nr:class I SAM-dependent RNA methyltransferase [Tomitella sp.]
YGGAGVYAAALASQVGPGGHVDVVESSSQAVRDGRDALADLSAVRFHHGRVENVLPGLSAEGGGSNRGRTGAGRVPDVTVLDPPRAGAGREVIGMLADSGVGRVVHVGCDPASFARDLALYTEHGFVVEEMRARDGFPMTHHFESFALLVR